MSKSTMSQGLQASISTTYVTYVVQSLVILFILANSADPNGMPRFVAFHLGLSCFPKYPLDVPSIEKSVKSSVLIR